MSEMNSTLKNLQKLNPTLNIESVFEKSFLEYGNILNLKCQNDLISKLNKDTDIPENGNIYKAFIREWEDKEIIDELSSYYEDKIEIGYCNGQNTALNALEWHNCDEINVYSTDVVLFLAKVKDLNKSYSLDSKDVKAFYVPKNTSILLFKDTLHFSPCKTEKSGFKAIIVLSDYTNTELEEDESLKLKNSSNIIDSLIFKKNKYLICHKDATHLTKQGVKANITGSNYNLNI